MTIAIAANTKGEVIIGYGNRVAVIVDDVFRKHHVFNVKNICEDSSSPSTNEPESETVDSKEYKVSNVYCSLSSQLLAALVNHQFIIIWHRILGSEFLHDTWKRIKIINTKNYVITLNFSNNDRFLVYSDLSCDLMCIELGNYNHHVMYHTESPVNCLVFHSRSNLMAFSVLNDVRIVSFPVSGKGLSVSHKKHVKDLLFTSNFLISLSEDGWIKFWDPKTGDDIMGVCVYEYLDFDIFKVKSIFHHCRNKRILVLFKGTSKFFWFDYTKHKGIKKTFICDLPMQANLNAACWDFHGIFWAGTGLLELPFVMYFIDLEQAKIFEVDEAQDHRYKAIVRYIFNKKTSSKSFEEILIGSMSEEEKTSRIKI